MDIIFFMEEAHLQKISMPETLNYKLFFSLNELETGIKSINFARPHVLISFGIREIIPEIILDLFFKS